MREIKFRAYDKHKKVMIYDYDQSVADIYDMILGEDINQKVYLIGRLNQTLMLSTGLLDKTGKEIFEGDIVSAFGTIDQIYWHVEAARFCLENKDVRDGLDDHLYLVVIGNIYENPELINREPEDE